MGTRSLTHIYDGTEILMTLYRQFDGYPEGYGAELAEFLNGLTVVNGITDRSAKIANGMGCLAAQIVKHFKEEAGGLYVYPAGSKKCGEEFVYRIKIPASGNVAIPRDGVPVSLEIDDVNFEGETTAVLFTGTPAEVLAAIKSKVDA